MKNITEKNIFIKLHNLKEKYWIKTLIIESVFGAFPFLSTAAIKLFDFSENIELSSILVSASLIVFLIFFIAIFLFQISDIVYKKYLEKTDKQIKKKDLNFSLALLSNINDVCVEKINTLIKEIEKVKNNGEEAPKIIDKPCNQLRTIASAISKTINYNLSGTEEGEHIENDVRVNIIYKLVNEKGEDWNLADNNNFEYNNIKSITDNPKSFFNFAIRESSKTVMKNNKQKIYGQQHYIPCAADGEEMNGSILYYKMPIKNNRGKEIINTLIMVYTCKNKFADDTSKEAINNAKYNIETVLMKFEPRIKIEMCLYYLHYLNKCN